MPSGVYTRTKPAWNKGLTKDSDERIADAQKKKEQTNLQKYGVTNVLQSKEVLDKISSDRHSGELAKRAKETKEKRYGDPNYNNMEKNYQTKLDRYGDPHYNNMEQMFLTKLKNGTYNTSRPEEELYKELCRLYCEEDIKRQYSDSRYPFKCDFYIESEDLFIELNYHQSHGLHPYDPNNKEDVELINLWRSKQNQEGPKNQYWAYEKVFTETDPLKLKYAKQNKLNYLMIYRNGLEIKI